MLIFALAGYPIVTYSDGNGGTITYYYYDSYTWIVLAVAAAWLIWYLVRRYRRARALRRKPGSRDPRLDRVIKFKQELSANLLGPGFAGNIHAVGVGLTRAGENCIQVFIADSGYELWPGGGAARFPDNYRGVPVVMIEMPIAGFLTEAGPDVNSNQYPRGIRDQQEVIVGGISGANTNLTGESGTIGYFCKRRSLLPRRGEVHLLSNSHVFADLRKGKVDAGDLIMQPSPGESSSNRPIGTLVNFSPLIFGHGNSNQVDAAIAKLWRPHAHQPLIPQIGAVQGYVQKKNIALGEAVRKFGRTTGYTEGRIHSIYLDIWVRYDRTGQSAFFKNQILIEPGAPEFAKFVTKGDSGSLVTDAKQYAVGLIFAGRSDAPATVEPGAPLAPPPPKPPRVEGYGVANPISDVLDHLKIDLLIETAS